LSTLLAENLTGYASKNDENIRFLFSSWVLNPRIRKAKRVSLRIENEEMKR
jgi:hypothetical protein